MRKSKRGFSFVAEVKVSHLIDSPIVFFARISLAGEWMNNQECFKLASRRSVLFFVVLSFFVHGQVQNSTSHCWSHCKRRSKVETRKKCAKIERMLVGYTGGSRVFYANENRFLSKWGSFVRVQLYPREWARGAWDRAWKCVTGSDGAGIARGCVERVGMSLEKAGPLNALPLFTDAKVLPLTFLYHQTISNLMRDVHTNKVPSGILNLFKKNN